MSNSVVKVSDEQLNDSLLLLVGEDGTVAPERSVVESYLNSKNEATKLQVMHINKSDSKGMEVTIDNLTYQPEPRDVSKKEEPVETDDIAHILYSFRLDHDYTPLTSPKPTPEEDELAKTLSILDGGAEDATKPPVKVVTIRAPPKTIKTLPPVQKPIILNQTIKLLPKAKVLPPRPKTKVKLLPEEDLSDLDDSEFDVDLEDDDSDFEINQEALVKKKTKAKTFTPEKQGEETSKSGRPTTPIPTTPLTPMTELSPITPAETKKTPRKEKKPPKPIPDDFALFSTPDIIRRVGKDGDGPSVATPLKPAKITQETRSKSDCASPIVQKTSNVRLSLDSKSPDKAKIKPKRPSIDKIKDDDLSSINLDASGLDLDPALLDNINNDIISEDLLYQVAQSLVSNPELQNAIEKGINEGVLDSSIGMEDTSTVMEPPPPTILNSSIESPVNKSGQQIIRPDGTVLVLPAIERPATRSRNKKQDDDKPQKPVFKTTHKPLDEEHVSGNELDSSNGEEESEDDPNKLWCVCNQPHNNRFMICCDTCEEWYHGKCVNITKLMGQQMESEGKEWICRFCKDPNLSRPQAAARRIRKASRNSRASTDSCGTTNSGPRKMGDAPGVVPCVVCQKPARKNSIFCSEPCILQHAQGVERVVVFERATGKMLSGNKAPSAATLDSWLKAHPGYEVVKSGTKIVTAKPQLQQSRLKLVKNDNNAGVSLAVQKKSGVQLGVLRHQPKVGMTKGPAFKIVSRQINTKDGKTKLIQPQPLPQVATPKTSIVAATTPSPKLKLIKKIVTTPPAVKDKPQPVKTPKIRQAEQQIVKPQENIRENVQKTLLEQLMNRLKLVDDLKLTEEEVKNISTEIESQLFKCFGDTGQKYRNKYRSLIFNIKDIKNQTLWRRICEKTINPYELVRLSPDDLASQELALWREREAKHQLDMIKKSELELLNCNRQYVLKTHKGEQVLEDSRPTDNLISTDVIKSLTEPISSDGSQQTGSGDSFAPPSSSKDKKSSSKHRSRTKDHRHRDDKNRRRSRSRERKRSRSRDRHRKSSHKSSRHKKETPTDKLDKKSKEILEQLVDKQIVPPLEDRLWKHVAQEDVVAPVVAESDSDHEPTSTVTIPTPPRSSETDDFPAENKQAETAAATTTTKTTTKDKEMGSTSPQIKTPISPEIWRGSVNMIDVAQISITAHEVSGDCTGLGPELPTNLDIVGRISPSTVWDYIGKMKCSNSKGISLLRLNATNVEEKMPYLALYSYLNSRERLGVVKSTNKAVKDFYIFPLASSKPIPPALLPLSGPGFEESRPALLLGIIVRDKRKRPFPEGGSTSQSNKRAKTVTTPPLMGAQTRSYTPPPVKVAKPLGLPLPPTTPPPRDDDEEPYSPEDSDPDTNTSSMSYPDIPAVVPSSYSLSNQIPGLEDTPLDSTTLEIKRQMEELNKKIEAQKSEINNISQNIASASSEIGTSVLSNIALPSNLQQILDSIKTITPTEQPSEVPQPVPPPRNVDTIPLLIPKLYPRISDLSLNLKPKKEPEKPTSVLSSLSEADLIRKAAEMLGESQVTKNKRTNKKDAGEGSKRAKMDVELPPVPGLD